MKNTEPYTVSILVPVYGVEKYIDRCARSIFEQTYHDLDIVFVDDCTPDKSIEILNRVLEDYPERKEQTRILRHDHNRGLSAARNTAVAAATGIFLTHVDSDDWLELDAVEEFVKKQMETSADIVTGDFIIWKKDGKESFVWQDMTKDEYIVSLLTNSCKSYMCGRLIKRAIYIENGISAKEGCDFQEDWQALPRLVYLSHSIAFTHRLLYNYDLTNENSFSADFVRMSGERYSRIIKQSVESFFVLKAFFSNKKRYSTVVYEYEPKFLVQYMVNATKCANKPLFYYLKSCFTKLDKQQKSMVNMGGRLSYVLKTNYHYWRILYWVLDKLHKV